MPVTVYATSTPPVPLVAESVMVGVVDAARAGVGTKTSGVPTSKIDSSKMVCILTFEYVIIFERALRFAYIIVMDNWSIKAIIGEIGESQPVETAQEDGKGTD